MIIEMGSMINNHYTTLKVAYYSFMRVQEVYTINVQI